MPIHERVDEFIALFKSHSWQLRGFVRALVPLHSDSEDVFQEVSRTLWTEFDRFQSGTDFLAWARAVARFKVLQYRRKKDRCTTNISDAVFDLLSQDMIEAGDGNKSSVHFLTECLKVLPVADRQMIEARYVRGQTTQDVAEATRCSIDHVYRSLRRIHKILLTCIQRRLTEERITK